MIFYFINFSFCPNDEAWKHSCYENWTTAMDLLETAEGAKTLKWVSKCETCFKWSSNKTMVMISEWTHALRKYRSARSLIAVCCCIECGGQRPLAGSQFMRSFPQFGNPLWPRLQRYPPDGDVSTHFQILAEPLLAGFWHRWHRLFCKRTIWHTVPSTVGQCCQFMVEHVRGGMESGLSLQPLSWFFYMMYKGRNACVAIR